MFHRKKIKNRNRKCGRENQRGFTLIELVLYTALVGILVVALAHFAMSTSESRNKIVTKNYVEDNGNIAIQRMTREIRQALSVDIGQSVWGVSPGHITLNVNGADTPVVIEMVGTDLQITLGSNGPYFLLDNQVKAESLIFTDLSLSGDATNIGIELGLKNVGEDVSPSMANNLLLTTSVSLRL